MSGVASDPAGLLRRLRPLGGTARPTSGVRMASAGALGAVPVPGRASTSAPGTPPSTGAAATTAALLRAAEAAAEALAEPDAELAREREETAAGIRAEAPDPSRAGTVEVLPNGTRLHYCRACGRLATWGFGVASERGRAGRWFCFEHRETTAG